MAVDLVNVSARPLTVTAVRPAPGFAVRLLEPDGRPVELPLELPAGDFSTPRMPDSFADEGRRVIVRVTVADCSVVASQAVGQVYGGPLVEADLRAGDDEAIGLFGDRYRVAVRLKQSTCGGSR